MHVSHASVVAFKTYLAFGTLPTHLASHNTRTAQRQCCKCTARLCRALPWSGPAVSSMTSAPVSVREGLRGALGSLFGERSIEPSWYGRVVTSRTVSPIQLLVFFSGACVRLPLFLGVTACCKSLPNTQPQSRPKLAIQYAVINPKGLFKHWVCVSLPSAPIFVVYKELVQHFEMFDLFINGFVRILWWINHIINYEQKLFNGYEIGYGWI